MANWKNATGVVATLFAVTTALSTPSLADDTNKLNLDVSASYSHLILGSTDFLAVVDYLNLNTLDHVEDHDGKHNGGRLDLSLNGISMGHLFDMNASLAVNGYYGRYESKQNANCSYIDGVQDCVIFPLTDPDAAHGGPASPTKPAGPTGSGEDFSGGLLSIWDSVTDREVTTWGIAVETRLQEHQGNSGEFGNDVGAQMPIEWRVGVAFKRIDQDSSYYAIDTGPLADPVTLDEDLVTDYIGAYVGFQSRHPLDNGGLTLVLNGEGGLYYSNTDYSASYAATDTFGGPGVPLSQTLKLDDQNAAFIGRFGMELEQDFNFATLALFGMAEWYSHAPDVKYNSYERNGGGVLDLVGSQDGTELGTTTAYSYTVGLRASFPLQ